ncbi:MAG: type I asparaginase [Alistipes sp.]|nr:type I asparaginase [Alistipes sp.]
MEKKTRILVIYTGGTIGMQRDNNGTLVPFDFNTIEQEFPSVRHLNVDISVHKMSPIDSSNVTPALWLELSRIIAESYDNFDGFVVLHGTDTMSYTASALSFMLENLTKPIVFTGSQIPMGILRTDGRENLITAIEIAALRRFGRAVVPEVSLYFQNKLFRANRTTKLSADALNAFDSPNYPPLAEVGVNIVFKENYIRQPRVWGGNLSISNSFVTDVVVLKLFPGIAEQTLRSMLSVEGLRGVVLESFGTGNAPTAEWFIDILRDAINRGITILNVTQCVRGRVAMELYETGLRLQDIGVITARDMTSEAAVTKLMWVLANTTSKEEVAELMLQNLRGEFTE